MKPCWMITVPNRHFGNCFGVGNVIFLFFNVGFNKFWRDQVNIVAKRCQCLRPVARRVGSHHCDTTHRMFCMTVTNCFRDNLLRNTTSPLDDVSWS